MLPADVHGSGSQVNPKTGQGKIFHYAFPSPLGNVEISAMHRSKLTPLSPEDDAEHLAGTSGQRPVAKQLQVFLPRTPVSPGPSQFSGPWHGRQTDVTNSRSSSPVSSRSSPLTTPSSSSQVLSPGDILPILSRLSGQEERKSSLNTTKEEEEEEEAPAESPPAEGVSSLMSLEEAVSLQEVEIVSELLERGSNPDGDFNSEVSPLIIAAASGNEKIVRMLLAAGANIEFQDSYKGTALHHAAAEGHRGVVKLLLVAGANMFHKTDDGHLAVQLTSDSRIRHLLACRMRSTSEGSAPVPENGQVPKTPSRSSTPSPLHSEPSSSSSSLSSSLGEREKLKSPMITPNSNAGETTPKLLPSPPHSPSNSRQKTYVAPLRNEHFEPTMMPHLSPRSESPKNIQHLMQQKRAKYKEKVDSDLRIEPPKQAETTPRTPGKQEETTPRSPERTEMTSREGSQDSPQGQRRTRRKSVQFAPEEAVVVGTENQEAAKDKEAATSSSSADHKGKSPEPAPPPEEPEEKPKPETPFRWTKGELLGEGAYGKVFSGLNQSTGELMAVKQLKIDPAEGQDKEFYLAAMEREISLYKKLRHKHIVGYINMEQDPENDSLYIFLEYVSGGSIQSMLERFGRFSESLVRVYTRQLLLGLHYLHQNKIVHRDIKGGNVLVDGVGVVKLADFGASKAFHDPTITNECKSIRGSVFWMAPEVIKGDGYGRRADIWSVGCTVIEMLTATHPWPDIDNTWSAIFHIAKASSGPPIPQHGSDRVKDFLQQCFQLDPALRPTASQLLEHPFVLEE